MLRRVLPASLVLAIVVTAALLAGCPPSAPKSQELPPEIPTGKGATEPAGTVNAETQPATNAEAATETQAAAGDLKSLAETKCSKCHPFAEAIEHRRDAEGWKKVVTSMAAKKEGWISPSEAEQIAQYLAQNYGK
jgi:mono/diheme cytochrome c family protein